MVFSRCIHGRTRGRSRRAAFRAQAILVHPYGSRAARHGGFSMGDRLPRPPRGPASPPPAVVTGPPPYVPPTLAPRLQQAKPADANTASKKPVAPKESSDTGQDNGTTTSGVRARKSSTRAGPGTGSSTQ